jgi:hypothetical protein
MVHWLKYLDRVIRGEANESAALPRGESGVLMDVVAMQDVRTAGALLEMLAVASDYRRETLQSALSGLFPKMRREHVAALTSAQAWAFASIVSLSDPVRDAEFLVAALEMLEQHGDNRWAPAVRDAVRISPHGAVREAAQACLSAIELRASHAGSGRVLLRAADGEATGLLLPVVNASDMDTLSRPEARAH